MGKTTGREPGFNASSEGFKKAEPVVAKAPTPAPNTKVLNASKFPVQEDSNLTPVELAAQKFKKTEKTTRQQKDIEYGISVASIIGMEPTRGGNVRDTLTPEENRLPKADKESERIRKEISKDFGKVAAGGGPRGRMIPTVIAQRINAKYPMASVEDKFEHLANPKAINIARRYMSLFGNKAN